MKEKIRQIWTLEPGGRQCRVEAWLGSHRIFVRFYPADPDLETMKRRKSTFVDMAARSLIPKKLLPSDEKGIDFETWKRRRLASS